MQIFMKDRSKQYARTNFLKFDLEISYNHFPAFIFTYLEVLFKMSFYQRKTPKN